MLWTSIWALAVVGGGVGEGSGAEKSLDREPEVLTTDRYVKSPLDVFNAFERGFAGFPPIDVMDAPTSKYRRWRAGGDRHKKFYDWKVVISDIRNQTQDKVDQEKLMGTTHLKCRMKSGRAISSLAKLIREDKARAKSQS